MTGIAAEPPVEFLAVARRLADEVLFPAASRVESSGVVPRAQLDLIAQSGLYGLFRAPPGPPAYRVVETLASGCLATAFVWLQHHTAVRTVAASQQLGVPATWLDRLVRGEVRAGVALGGLRPGPPSLRVRPVPGGYELTGAAPWVTGFEYVDILLVAARDADDVVTWLLLDAQPAPTLTVEPLKLLAVNASRTVHIRFDQHPVPADRLVGTLPFAQWPERDAAGLRGNGSLALGLVDRCRRLLVGLADEPAIELGAALDATRDGLDTAGPDELPSARAAASALAVRAAATLVTATGARAALSGDTAERLLREAGFLLVFGSRPSIRFELLRQLVR